jgi:site-specific recombinase XerD
MKPICFKSPLAERMDRFVRLRQASGRDYQSQAYLLGRFDRFLNEEGFNDNRITRELTEGYQQALTHLAQTTRYIRFCVVRQFCEYLALDDPQSYVPLPMRHVSTRGARVPYIYSKEQIKASYRPQER